MTLEKGWQDRFLHKLAETGNVTAACRHAKCSRQEAYRTREEDAFFMAGWQEAKVVAKELLELEARRRAETGYLDPVYYEGKKVGAVRKYSDTLLIFLLKALEPETYRENIKHEHSGPGDGPIPIGIVKMPVDQL